MHALFRSGIVLDEPMQAEQSNRIVLTQPAAGEEGCCIHLTQLSQLGGYRVMGVELWSAARVVELYSGLDGEYMATSRGSALENTELVHNDGALGPEHCGHSHYRDGQLYSCKANLPTERVSTCDHLTIKVMPPSQ